MASALTRVESVRHVGDQAPPRPSLPISMPSYSLCASIIVRFTLKTQLPRRFLLQSGT